MKVWIPTQALPHSLKWKSVTPMTNIHRHLHNSSLLLKHISQPVTSRLSICTASNNYSFPTRNWITWLISHLCPFKNTPPYRNLHNRSKYNVGSEYHTSHQTSWCRGKAICTRGLEMLQGKSSHRRAPEVRVPQAKSHYPTTSVQWKHRYSGLQLCMVSRDHWILPEPVLRSRALYILLWSYGELFA